MGADYQGNVFILFTEQIARDSSIIRLLVGSLGREDDYLFIPVAHPVELRISHGYTE